MTVNELLSTKRLQILQVATKHGASNVRVFGSSARGESGPDSDVDFLVDLEPSRSLLDHAGLVVELEDLLGRPVDVVPAKTLKARVRDRILREAVPL